MRFPPSILLTLLAALVAAAAPPALVVPDEVRPTGQYVRVSPKTDAVAVAYVGLDGVEPIPSDVLKDGRLFLLDARGLAPGRYRFAAVAASKEGEQARADFVVVIPGPPVPPTPPGPTPPVPPPPGPAPIPGDGLRVLIVYESSEVAKYAPGQITVLYAKDVRDYLNARCVKANNWPEWRVFDKDADASGESDLWKAALKRDRKTLPWLVVSNGRDGYEGPLPASVDEALALLKKYGGN